MPGRPRSRRAQTLAMRMLTRLRQHGPARIDEMLDETMFGPADWQQMNASEKASARMAIAILLHDHGVRLDVDGCLYVPPARKRVRTTDRDRPLYIPAEWSEAA